MLHRYTGGCKPSTPGFARALDTLRAVSVASLSAARITMHRGIVHQHRAIAGDIVPTLFVLLPLLLLVGLLLGLRDDRGMPTTS
jgi:hypothetical protein